MHSVPKDKTYAIIGASNNTDKYGYKVLKDLFSAGYLVVPINPNESVVMGLVAYPSVLAYPGTIDVAVFIVPPPVTLRVLDDVYAKGIRSVWMQPGSESSDAIAFCAKHNISCVHDACVMVARRQ